MGSQAQVVLKGESEKDTRYEDRYKNKKQCLESKKTRDKYKARQGKQAKTRPPRKRPSTTKTLKDNNHDSDYGKVNHHDKDDKDRKPSQKVKKRQPNRSKTKERNTKDNRNKKTKKL